MSKYIVIIYVGMTIGLFGCNQYVFNAIQRPEDYLMPRNYVIYRPIDSINIDGKPNEASWQNAEWSSLFVDILGKERPMPVLDTRFKILWSGDFLYVFAQMQEPQIWGKITERDAVIFQDDDFEIFIDPDGDGHNYTEIEVNALNTVWDLLLLAAYGYHDRDKVLWHWNLTDLKTATYINGTINDPQDTDEGWTVEMAIPMKALNEFAGDQKAKPGIQWRMNFSRVDWHMEVSGGKYEKVKNGLGNTLPEENWVWSPQGRVAMHLPEKWGYVQFSDLVVGTGEDKFIIDQDFAIKQSLYAFFHKLKQEYNQHKAFPKKVNFILKDNLKSCDSKFEYESMTHRFELSYFSCETKINWIINEEGRLYSSLPSSLNKN